MKRLNGRGACDEVFFQVTFDRECLCINSSKHCNLKECVIFSPINSPLLSPTFTISRRCAERHIKWLRIPALCAVADADADIDAGCETVRAFDVDVPNVDADTARLVATIPMRWHLMRQKQAGL